MGVAEGRVRAEAGVIGPGVDPRPAQAAIPCPRCAPGDRPTAGRRCAPELHCSGLAPMGGDGSRGALGVGERCGVPAYMRRRGGRAAERAHARSPRGHRAAAGARRAGRGLAAAPRRARRSACAVECTRRGGGGGCAGGGCRAAPPELTDDPQGARAPSSGSVGRAGRRPGGGAHIATPRRPQFVRAICRGCGAPRRRVPAAPVCHTPMRRRRRAGVRCVRAPQHGYPGPRQQSRRGGQARRPRALRASGRWRNGVAAGAPPAGPRRPPGGGRDLHGGQSHGRCAAPAHSPTHRGCKWL
jgi:hypothetical protein